MPIRSRPSARDATVVAPESGPANYRGVTALGSSASRLSCSEAPRRLAVAGPNAIHHRQVTALGVLLAQLRDTLAIQVDPHRRRPSDHTRHMRRVHRRAARFRHITASSVPSR
ncbi:MAG TPA: cation-transporting P-type ATPase [Solirubrobacteraceae bacterium]